MAIYNTHGARIPGKSLNVALTIKENIGNIVKL